MTSTRYGLFKPFPGYHCPMIYITESIQIDDQEIVLNYIRSSGPGGQNVNKTATSVQLRFNILESQSLPGDVKNRLQKLGGRRVTDEGVLVIEASRYRTQELNRQDALERLTRLVRKAAEKPKSRVATRPSAEEKRKRLNTKKARGEIKRLRRKVDPDHE